MDSRRIGRAAAAEARSVSPCPTADVTVVIPAHNEEVCLPNLLRDLAAQTVRPAQIVVADSASTDGTVRVARALSSEVPGLTVIEAPRGASQARNAGAAQAVCRRVLFVDADARVRPDFVAGMVDAAEASGRATLVAPRIEADRAHLQPLAWLLWQYFKRFADTRAPAVPGHAILIDRHVHETIEGFDSTLHLCEDHDYARRARLAGARVVWVDEVSLIASTRRFSATEAGPSMRMYGHAELTRVWDAVTGKVDSSRAHKAMAPVRATLNGSVPEQVPTTTLDLDAESLPGVIDLRETQPSVGPRVL